MKEVILLLVEINAQKVVAALKGLSVPEDSWHIIIDDSEAEAELISLVREERPKGVIIDASLDQIYLENICTSVENTAGTFDMYLRLYSLEGTVKFPGVTAITMDDVKQIIEES